LFNKVVLLLLTISISNFLLAQDIFFEDDFEEGEFDLNFWSPSQGGTEVRVGDAWEGHYSAYIGGPGDATLDLTLDLSGTNQAELQFFYKDYGAVQNPLTGLWLSEDGGGHFVKVYSFAPERWGTCWGSWPSFDLDELASQAGLRFNSRFVIRFRQDSLNGIGMGLDSVKVFRPQEPTYATLPFRDRFESTLGNSWRRRFPYPHDNLATSPCGFAAITSRAISENQSLLLGKQINGAFSTQAIDLHLNLAGHDRVVLQFMIGVLGESEHTLDGLYFSDDAGGSFVKAFSFKAFMWDMPGYGGRLPPLELGEMARDLGLELSDRFVIRFQQHDNGASLVGGDDDGIWIDEVEVTSPPLVYARPPFEDGFEQGKFEAMWAWRNSSPTSFNLRNSGIVSVKDDFFGFSTARSGNYGVMFAKDGVSGNLITANALDLHLNLADIDGVELRFFIKDFGWEEAEPEDGIYLQPDNDSEFVKIYAFSDAIFNGSGFREVVLALSDLAQDLGLRLGSRCRVRFQQVGRNSPAQFFEHGWIIDDVRVSGMPTSARALPVAVVPWVVHNDAFVSRIAVFNDGQQNAELDLNAVDRDGRTTQKSISLAAKSLFAVPAQELFPGMSGFAITVASNSPNVYTSMLTSNIEPQSGGDSPSQTTANRIQDLSNRLLFGYLPVDQFSAVVLVTPEVTRGSTPLTFEIYGPQGQLLRKITKTLHSNAPFAVLVKDLIPEASSEVAIVAHVPQGILLAGTTFIFNQQRQPSMSRPFTR